MAQARICQLTGLALQSSPATVVRIARESYGALAPPPRDDGSDVDSWSRYDTVGRTAYASSDRQAAFMELLAPYRTIVDGQRRALQTVADFMGLELDVLWRQVVDEWDQNGHMRANWLPTAFRDGRTTYTISFPSGWWIDLTATETLYALRELFGDAWPTRDGKLDEPLTVSHLTSDDRVLTTAIASRLRNEVELDDGTLPLGVHFGSKHGRPATGSGSCWAYWMRAVDNGLEEPAKVISAEGLKDSDTDYRAALELCRIRSR